MTRTTGSTILSIAYGIDVREEGDPYVDAAEEVMRAVSETIGPGSFLVNVFPLCKSSCCLKSRWSSLRECR